MGERWRATDNQAEIAMDVFEGRDWRNCREADECDELIAGMRETLTAAVGPLVDSLMVQLNSAEWRLAEEQKTLMEYEALLESHGFDGDTDDPIEWLERRLEGGVTR